MGSTAWLLGVLLTIWAGPLLAQTAAPAPAAPAAGLPGVYDCQGTGADGKAYRGAVIIQPDGNRFVLQWYVGTQLSAIGLGLREGNILAVSFFGPDAGGIILYKIDGARLVGQWSAPVTAGRVFEETLTRVADVPPATAPPASAPTKPRPSSPRLSGKTRPA
jgi:hypothetical protein